MIATTKNSPPLAAWYDVVSLVLESQFCGKNVRLKYVAYIATTACERSGKRSGASLKSLEREQSAEREITERQ